MELTLIGISTELQLINWGHSFQQVKNTLAKNFNFPVLFTKNDPYRAQKYWQYCIARLKYINIICIIRIFAAKQVVHKSKSKKGKVRSVTHLLSR